MKKILGWTLAVLIIVTISVLYHKSITEDTVVDEIDLEGIVEREVSTDSIDKISTEKDVGSNISTNNNVLSGDSDNAINNSSTNYMVTNDGENKQEVSNEIDLNNSGDGNNKDTDGSNGKLEVMSGSYSSLSNKTNAWGFVRKPEGTQPEFHGPYTKVLDDYEGIYAGNAEKKVIYLTFDEGYENGYTGSILDSLKEKNVVAVFFVTLPYVKANPDLIKRMIDEGHIVGNHISRTSMYHIKIS